MDNKNKKERIPVKWWDIECDQVIKRRKDKLKEFSDKCDIKSFIEFKKARTIATKTIQNKKRKDLEDFLLKINRFTNAKYMWNKLKLMKKSRKKIEWNKQVTNDKEK